jgi:flagellar hook-associated protein 3 FlgL
MSNQSKYVDLNYQYSTQKKVNNLSDDPISLTTLMNSKNDIAKIKDYLTSIKNCDAKLQMADDTLGLVNTDLNRVYELATTASNETNSTDQLNDIADEVESALKNILTLANTKYNDSYLFSGANVQTPPYDVDSGNYQYKGTTDADGLNVSVQITDNFSINSNENGNSIFGEYYTTVSGTTVSSGVIGNITALLKDLRSTPPNYAGIRAKLDTIKEDIDNVTYYQAKAGTNQNALDKAKTQLQSQSLSSENVRSNIEDADLVEVASKMQYQQFALQASLQASSSVLQQSLLNFLK